MCNDVQKKEVTPEQLVSFLWDCLDDAHDGAGEFDAAVWEFEQEFGFELPEPELKRENGDSLIAVFDGTRLRVRVERV